MLSRRTVLAALAAVPVVSSVSSAARALPAQARALLGVAPTPAPDRIALNPTPTPSSSVAITWRTNDATATGLVEYVAGSGPVRSADAATTARVRLGDNPATRHHTATLEGLAPGTRYSYRVGSAESGWSPWHDLATASTTPSPGWSFLYFGDAQIGLDTVWPVNVQRALAAYPDAVLSLHAGDLINDADDDEQWAHWFAGAGALAHSRLVVASPGNHEYSGDSLLQQYRGHFEMPGNGPALHDEDVWFCDYQGVRFVSLNGNAPLGGPEQATWMRRLLEENPGRWSVVTFHQPMFSATPDRDNALTRATWLPVFEEAGVDLVLQGHDHTYARGHVADNENPDGTHSGPVYVVSNGGGKHYELAPAASNNWTVNGAVRVVAHEGLTTYQGVEVYDDRLVYRSWVGALRDDTSAEGFEVGDLVDAFTIIASPTGKAVHGGVHLGPWAPGPGPANVPQPAPPERATPVVRVTQQRHRLAVSVNSPAGAPTGAITVSRKGRPIARRRLSNTRARLALPKRLLGKTVTVHYDGDASTAPATVRFRLKRPDKL